MGPNVIGDVGTSKTPILERAKESRAHQRPKRASGRRRADAAKALHLFFVEAKPWHRRELVSQAAEQRNNGHAGKRGKERTGSGADARHRFRSEWEHGR